MRGAHGPEVPVVERGELPRPQSLGQSHDRRVNDSKREVGISLHEFGQSTPFRPRNALDDELTVGDRTAESDLRVCSDSVPEQVSHFRNDQLGDDERPGRTSQQIKTAPMVLVSRRRGRVERTGVNDEHCACGTALAG